MKRLLLIIAALCAASPGLAGEIDPKLLQGEVDALSLIRLQPKFCHRESAARELRWVMGYTEKYGQERADWVYKKSTEIMRTYWVPTLKRRPDLVVRVCKRGNFQ